MRTLGVDDDAKALAEDLKSQIAGEVRFDKMTRAMYSTDASIYQIEPIGVVIPRTSEDVIAVVETANRYKVPVLPRGGGTSLAGQTVGPAIVIDLSRFLERSASCPASSRKRALRCSRKLSTSMWIW